MKIISILKMPILRDHKFKRYFPIVLLLTLGCIDPYQAKLKDTDTSFLVVEGFLNGTTGSATVILSHTQPVNSTDPPIPETGANVSISTGLGQTWYLYEQSSGKYVFNGIPVDASKKYTLHISTNGGGTFSSDEIQVRNTVPIDTISFDRNNDGKGLNILVSAHDASGSSRYYAWNYIVTYEYNAPFISSVKFVDGVPIFRDMATENISRCWRTINSSSIQITSTTQLRDDIVNQFALATIPKGSIQISARYSILVQQHVITEKEYAYLSELKKTTENLGSIFGSPPSAISGNVHQESDATVPVLGYFSGGFVSEKRFFIERTDLPEDFLVPNSRMGCVADTAKLPLTIQPTAALISALYNKMGGIYAYLYTIDECIDCRFQGGVLQRPDFW